MRILSELRERLRALLFRAREDRELEEELQFHLDMATEENLRRGLDPVEARRRAMLRLGGLTQVRESTRAARGVGVLERLGQDVRYGLRGMWRNPVFATALILTLGLGIGASAAMFSVTDALLLRPLPYPESDRLVDVMAGNPETGQVRRYVASEFARTWAEQAELFDAAFHHTRATVLFTAGAEPVSFAVHAVSPGFGRTLGVLPILGRGIAETDAHPGAEPVALLSHGFWRSAFGGDPGVVDGTVELDGVAHRIIGVMPPGFRFPEYSTTEAWVALREDGSVLGRAAGSRPLEMVARLRGDISVDAAQERADALAASLAEAMPRDGGWHVRLMATDGPRGNPDMRQAVWFLAAAVGLILLVAALNGVSLLLVRGWSRTRELAVRLALGAPRRRLFRQLMTENVIHALAAGVVAVLLALVTLRLIGEIIPSTITFWAPFDIGIERRTLLFTFGLAVAVGLGVGLLPALLAARLGTATADAALTPYAARAPRRSRLRRTLVVSEVALSVALLVGAGLLIHSFVRLIRVDPGFRLENVAILSLSLSPASYPTGGARMEFLRRLEERVETMPGVIGATTGGGGLPAGGISFSPAMETEDGIIPGEGIGHVVNNTSVSPDFFELLDVRVVAGRTLTDEDMGTDHAVVNTALARLLWGDGDPVGRRFRVAEGWSWYTVVGVVGDLRLRGPADEGSLAFLYPASSSAASYASIAVRTTGDPRALLPQIRAAVHELDLFQPIARLEPLASVYAEAVDMPRFLLIVMSVLSALALLLAAIGVYGVLAYDIAQRRFELGVRIALGARPAAVARRVLAEGVALAAIGVALGLAGALLLAGLIRGLLFGVEPRDPFTMVAVTAVALAAAAAASWWPARRALRIDPAEVLKSVT